MLLNDSKQTRSSRSRVDDETTVYVQIKKEWKGPFK
jgi:hypothetical protein